LDRVWIQKTIAMQESHASCCDSEHRTLTTTGVYNVRG
jgi:hypothetical protein